jgi:hypothetical protein
MGERIFDIGKPIPDVYLDEDFDEEDKKKYSNGEVIEDKHELDRLVDKYLFAGRNEYGIFLFE